MTFREFLRDNIVYLDGGMGTLLQEKGFSGAPEELNITHPEIIKDIHKAYLDAGSNVVSVNTFGASLIKYEKVKLEELVKAAIQNARQAQRETTNKGKTFVALDIGPTGKLLKPLGELDFSEAVEVFKENVLLGKKYGVDLVIIETMNDSLETKAALLAVKENSDLPVIALNAYGEDGTLMTGATPEIMVALLEGMGADAVGANCSLGPKQLRGVVERILKRSSVPVALKPNAGLPRSENGKTVFDVTKDGFAEEICNLIKMGVRVAGGCCGTTPEYIRTLVELTRDIEPVPLTDKNITVVASCLQAVELGKSPVLIGERINPTGKKRFKQALVEKDIDYILNEGVLQQEKGVHVLDVNVGLPDIDEGEMLEKAVYELQKVVKVPLEIDSADEKAMERALRIYNGKAMINSVNGKKESMDKIFPLVKKYGGVVVALTLDENGIPQTSEGRVDIAKRILKEAQKYGIKKKDIVFDTLAMTVSADSFSALTTLKAMNIIKNELHCHTSLGVSNVSFGLPERDAINSTFFALALGNGLSAAIMNPYSKEMMRSYFSFMALSGLDENCQQYISKAEEFASEKEKKPEKIEGSQLFEAIIKGFSDRAGEITQALVGVRDPLEIVNGEIIPALNTVGVGFEEKRVYLPQLLMSAEASGRAFEVIKASMKGTSAKNKGDFVIATVKGDIHDIGKNIVKLLLENYGFSVHDLGKDVSPEVILKKVKELHAPMVGLSALMTTTVPEMEKTIALLKREAPFAKIIVGGAVLTEEYAKKINADFYAKDAMETVRIAEKLTEAR